MSSEHILPDSIYLNTLTITVIKESDAKYRLTGINKVENKGIGDRIYSLNDPAMARVGGEKRARHYSRVFTLVCAADIRKQPCEYGKKLIGYVIHAHCWMVFGRVLGLTTTEIHLAKFVRASLAYCHDKERWGLVDMIADWPPCPVQSGLNYGYDEYLSPFILPAVQKAIYSARFMRQRPYPCFGKVPFDVVFLIAELVCPIMYTTCDVDDTRSMIIAFQWKLPDSFWRTRLNENEFFEFEELKKDTSPVDWQMLRLDMMILVSDPWLYSSSGLLDRKWLLETMLAIKSAYLKQI